MSQLQVTGAAKIRDIQGPVVANSGVITALDGTANQYVRGDGALADFPTSTGGGSSVSYYLNSSVSQGTIGGVAYRQLSKTPIIGGGTDITISANGYVASYITDANDPSLLEVPGGNFNCEFYFSVNSDAHNPYVYAELYKYNGTTFTLLGSSQSIPEYLSNGSTLSAYYFAVPVASAALTITDRLAIRIYVNVDTRIVTLHTENGHLCQVVTTFSKGMVSLNNLTKQTQFLATGTSGTNFAIVSSGDTHTFNLPVASAANTGKLSSTDWSVFNNKQTALSGTGFVKIVGTTISYDNSTYYLASNPSSFIALTSLSAGAGISYNNTTGVIASTITQYTDALARAAVSLTTTGTSGAATYNSTTGVFNIPNYGTALSAYLPLAGGTLTGALSGTTATFSGLGTFNQLTITGATAGRIFYAQTGGVVSQSGNLNWNETNGMLGVGTPNPSAIITAFSTSGATQFKAAGTAPAFTFSNTLTSSTLACVFGLATASNHFVTGTAAGDMAIANQSTVAGAIVFGTGTTERMRMSAAGRFLINTSVDNGASLQVNGAATFSSSVTVNGDNSIYNGGTANNFNTFALGIANTKNLVFVSPAAAQAAGRNWSGGIGSNASEDIFLGSFNNLSFGAGSLATRMTILGSNGNVGIGYSSPSAKLQVLGDIFSGGSNAGLFFQNRGTNANTLGFYADNNLTFLILNASTGNIASINQTNGVYTPLSDVNKKKDFEESIIGLKEVLQLKPTLYRMKDDDEIMPKELGFIAQEVKEFIPQAFVESGEDENKFIGLNYNAIVAALVKAIQEQQAQIEELKALIAAK